jgi:hypothetical protein
MALIMIESSNNTLQCGYDRLASRSAHFTSKEITLGTHSMDWVDPISDMVTAEDRNMYATAENRTLNILSPSFELSLCTGRHPLHVTKSCHVTGNGVIMTCT